ncbi:hypothetical protein [Streptomyces sp. NPDC058572]|uniref:hypothetical protein n=1 Tax=Streptomyces sp. NPDC058572 TaxID=3346546 RepID=UPI0036617236
MTITDLGEYGADFLANPYPYRARLREAGPVHRVRSAEGGPFRLIVGHEEARIAVRSLERCPGLAPDTPPGPYEWLPGLVMRGVRRLPVRW